jgi:dipeptidyl aminopeptidase/acylaminoacyl peptidase
VSPTAPFGTWDSPFGVAEVAAQRVSRYSLASAGDALLWLEGRPEEAGRVVLVRASVVGEPVVVSPPGTSIRSRVHEYGGGAWCLVAGAERPSSFAYVEERSQRVHVVTADGAEPVALTPEPPAGERWHHGGLVPGPSGAVLAVRERHDIDGGVERRVVWLDPGSPGTESVLCLGRDFYGALAPSPDGSRLAWVTWDHPNMPWDSTELWVGALRGDGSGWAVENSERVGGERLDGSSVDQPVWLGRDTLAFVADADGWWQPWMWRAAEAPVPVSEREAEFQGPAWAFGQHTLVALGPARLACAWRRDGVDHLGTLGIDDHRLTELAQPCVTVSSLCAHDGGVAWFGQTPSLPGGVWWCSPPGEEAEGAAAVRLSGPPSPLGEPDVSVAEPISVVSRGGRPVHANFYAPRRAGWEGPEGVAPPLIVQCHGGPTSGADGGFDPLVQMFTTRGYAVVTVNFAGSTGYGREYRRALEGQWGVADIDDCVEVATWLANGGRVDRERMAIRGGSAGGLTALGALVRSDVFAAAVSWYGVTDLMGLAASTHDFESRYTDRLIGPLPEAAALYEERSPLNRVGDITGAVLLLQGEDDPVVPADQTRRMAEALTARGIRCEARYFEGESHGFRRADTLIACFEAELAFYADVLLGAPEGA